MSGERSAKGGSLITSVFALAGLLCGICSAATAHPRETGAQEAGKGSGQAEGFGAADQPAPQGGNDPNSAWMRNHNNLVEKAKRGSIDLYFEGDSITRRWEATHKANWDSNFKGWKAADFGAGGDRTQNVLYRIENGELDGVNPKVIVLLIGTNNVGFEPATGSDGPHVEDTTRGIKACLDVLHKKAPKARILLVGITPRNTRGTTLLMPTINRINARIARFADGRRTKFLDINDKLADQSGKLFDGMTDDGLHLTDKGYQVWADAMKPILTKWLGPRPKTEME